MLDRGTKPKDIHDSFDRHRKEENELFHRYQNAENESFDRHRKNESKHKLKIM